MNTDKQRIAIAQACGWKYIGNDPELCPYWLAPKGDFRYGNPLNAELFPKAFPDYLNDLNAMHEAEKVLDYNQMNRYQNIELSRFVRAGTTWICRATSAERAEAFLRTLGKWEDDK